VDGLSWLHEQELEVKSRQISAAMGFHWNNSSHQQDNNDSSGWWRLSRIAHLETIEDATLGREEIK
jgi:hypothetical protein